MAGLGPTLTKKEFSNWVKGCLALLFTKDGLTDFVRMGIYQQHQRILQLVPTSSMQKTCNCTMERLPPCTENRNHSHIVPGPRHLCSKGICNILMDEICKDHRYRGPSWKNTDPQKWCTDAYEVAKCYMPDGYSNKTSLTETDFNGILAVVINNRSFTSFIQANLATEPNICTKAREVGCVMQHTTDHLLSDNDLNNFIDDLIHLLCDPACLMNNPSAQDAVRKLQMFKANNLTIHEKDVTEALRDNIRETLGDELRDILQTINKHFSQHQTDSVAEIDRIIADRKRELDEHTKTHKEEISRLAGQMTQDIVLYDRTKETKGYDENLKEQPGNMDVNHHVSRDDVRSAINKVFSVLVDYMDPKPILDKMNEVRIFSRRSTLRDILEKPTTSEKNRNLLNLIISRDVSLYLDFKRFLRETKQEPIFQLLEIAEKGEDTREAIEIIKQRATELNDQDSILLRELAAAITMSDMKKIMAICYVYVYIGKEVCRALLEKQVNDLRPSGHDSLTWSIDAFLEMNIETIKPILTNANSYSLFPKAKPDLWNLSLFCHILINTTCKISRPLRMCLKWLLEQETEFVFYNDQNYERKFEHMKECLLTIADETHDEDLIRKVKELFEPCQDGVISNANCEVISRKIERLTEELKHSMKATENQLQEINKGNLRMEKKLDEVLERLGNISMSNDSLPKSIPDIPVKIRLNEVSPETEIIASEKIVKTLNHAEAQSKLSEAIDDLNKKFKDNGYSITNNFKVGCVQMYLRCSSALSLFALLKDYVSGRLDAALEPLEKAVRMLDGCQRVKLETIIIEDDILNILSAFNVFPIEINSTDGSEVKSDTFEAKTAELAVIGVFKEDLVHETTKERQLVPDRESDPQHETRFHVTESNLEKGNSVSANNPLKEFQSDLIDFYRKDISEMPLSLLVKRNVVPLLDLYVKPPMAAIDLNQWLGDSSGNPVKTTVNNYRELFFTKDQTAFKDVYVTAETGVGKTAICNHICLTWCQAHKMIPSQRYVLEDVNAMKFFDFLFLISLKNVNVSQCDIDDFISGNINKLRKSTERCKYVENILDNKSCLIVLDGLDEWDHPTDCQNPGHEIDIPHSKYRSNCTIMTTTRPWKFDKLSLPPSKVDRHIEISNLDDDLSKQLATNAIKLLNDRSSRNKSPKLVDDFYDDTACLKLKDLRFIPYIHLQTVLLWHDGKSIGRSKSEILKNILIYVLERGLKRLEFDPSPAIQILKRSMKNWLQNETEFPQNSDFLRSLGRLAFYTLFGLEHPPRPKKDEALKYIGSEEDLELYLKFGLLSQNECLELVSSQQSDISFQDKTLQEFFSAIYIYHDSERSNTYRLIRNKCSSIQSILEMCNVFTFLSGLNPRLYTSTISNILSGPPTESSDMASVKEDCFLSSDAVVKNFRNGSSLYLMHDSSTYDVMFAFQTMQADCMHEIKVNGQQNCFPHIEDIIINKTSKTKKYISRIKNMVEKNQSNIKTLSVRQVNKEECEDLFENLEIHLLQSLEMLQFWAVVSQKNLEKILVGNLKTLKSVDISNVIFENNKHTPVNTPLSEECLNVITKMPTLKIISLEQISLTHSELERMVNFVSNRTELTHIGMMHIRCIHEDTGTCGVRLNLSRHEHLLGLGLHSVNINELYVNTEKLEVFMIGRLSKKGTASTCLKQIRSEPLIHTLSCRKMKDEDLSTFLHVIKTCWKLQKVYFYGTDFGERVLHLSFMHANLEFVDIHRSEISCSALVRLTNSVALMAQTVNITLDGCTVSPEEEYVDFKKKIREDKKFRVQFDDLNQQNRKEFRFQKMEG